MEQYHAQRLDLTGCSLDQMLYVINRGCPMIAILESAHAVLLTGYTMTDITYVDPSTGESYTVGMSEMENMTEAVKTHAGDADMDNCSAICVYVE